MLSIRVFLYTGKSFICIVTIEGDTEEGLTFMNVLIVESPAKARTINKYLGNDFKVVASMGHIRDLPSKDGSVDVDHDFKMLWESDARSEKNIREIEKAVKGAKALYLAPDPDREGEAIAWHVLDVLKERKKLKDIPVKRVVFHEITKSAVKKALENPRDLDQKLIDAYLARRALDYLVGFTLSPVLWRKLPGSKSAGRVQSVALRLICERENEIEEFKSQEYWSVDVDLQTPAHKKFVARLTHLDGKKLDKFDLSDEASATQAVQKIEAGDFKVARVEHKKMQRRPAPPFITSTLQQEASRKLGFSAKQTMSTAQRLYEGAAIGGDTIGLITYMRTDGVTMAQEAVVGVRNLIGKDYGARYLPASPIFYKSKVKNAQEAHEAIRPTDITRTPQSVSRYLDPGQLKLYELIWKRTVASQMANALLDQVVVDLMETSKKIVLRANGSILSFDGFLKVYKEDKDDAKDEEHRILPPMQEGDATSKDKTHPEQHFTQPPPRYSEASLVKSLEELGIGRPSTYASIISVLQDRNYVRLEKRRFIPEDRGRVVTSFLKTYFKQYVEYDFTAKLEDQLDHVSAGKMDWHTVLKDFWVEFHQHIVEAQKLSITDVINKLDEALGPHFFPPQEDGSDPRKCPDCKDGRLGLKLGKFGGFIGCSNYPECKHTRQLSMGHGESSNEQKEEKENKDRELGVDSETGLMIQLRYGPYGPYIQSGDGKKPRRMGLPKMMDPGTVDLHIAQQLLALPRDVGADPETGEILQASIGKFGPYVKKGGAYKSLPAGSDVLTIGLDEALDLLKDVKPKAAAEEIGKHPKDGKPITLSTGQYGPYVKHGKTLASVPKKMQDEKMTLTVAVELLNAKVAKGKKK